MSERFNAIIAATILAVGLFLGLLFGGRAIGYMNVNAINRNYEIIMEQLEKAERRTQSADAYFPKEHGL